MRIDMNYQDWNSAEDCLQWLFANHSDMHCYGGLHVWQESFATLGGGMLAGGFQRLRPEMLIGRVYSVRFSDHSVAVCYHDEVFAVEIPNRINTLKTRRVILQLPTITQEIGIPLV